MLTALLQPNHLVSPIAYQSEAQFETQLRGLTTKLNNIDREQSSIAGALIYFDMTTGSTGFQISFK